MAQTDTRPGFRLPWSSDRADSADNATTDGNVAVDEATGPTTDAAPEGLVETIGSTDAPEVTAEATPDAVLETAPEAVVETAVSTTPVAEAPTPAPVPARSKPNKFLADLTKAMQTTAEAARIETMERFTSEAKAATERVHAAAAEESAELRRLCDDDISGIRDWSKAEIARIREETENRISGRKGDLERELEAHSSTVESRIERVSAFVAAFEHEVASFYERLFAEEDPTKFASMAEQLPEPPSLDLEGLDQRMPILTWAPEPVTETEPVAEAVIETMESPADHTLPEATAEIVAEPTVEALTETPADAVVETTEVAGGTAEPIVETTEAVAETTADTAADPRLEALGMGGGDFAAAEAEAAMIEDDGAPDESDDEIPVIADEVLAARIAGLVPDESNGSSPLVTSKVVVSGLVSVASIAGFKRHLARMQGVTSVGVSSGPDGEFVFTVHHLPTTDLAEGVVALPGFDARVTGKTDDTIAITARDPESN